MSNWPTVPLSELTTKIGSGATPRGGKGAYKERGIPLIRSMNVYDLVFNRDGIAYLDDQQAAGLDNVVVQDGDVLLNITGASVARCCAAPSFMAGARVNQHVAIIRPITSKLDGRFLAYKLASEPNKSRLLNLASAGATREALTKGGLERYQVECPPLETQRRIASILGAYDDLIEVNRRRIAVLEEMARGLFEEWFVRFRFPGHEAVPILDTPDGPVPEGWSVRTIGDVGDVVTGKTPSKAVPEFFGGEVPFVKIPDLHLSFFVHNTGETLSEGGAASQSSKTVPGGALCVSCIGTIGLVAITVAPCQTNQQINTLIPPNQEWTEFLYFSLVRAKRHLINLGANGATIGNVNKKKFSGVRVSCPTSALLHAFHKRAAPMFALIRNVEYANHGLALSRDLLLPRLISGQLSVAEAERELEEAA